MDDIDLKFDKFIDQYNGDMRILLHTMNSALNLKNIGTLQQTSFQNMSNFNLSLDNRPDSRNGNGSNYNLTGSRRILSFAVGSELVGTDKEDDYGSDENNKEVLSENLNDKSSEEITLPFENELQMNEDSKANTSSSSVDSKKEFYKTSSSHFIVEPEYSLTKSEEILRNRSEENLASAQFHSEDLNEASGSATKKSSGIARMRSFN